MARSILITGCSSGIGLDAARTLHRRGWRVFATCRKPADCDRLRAEGLESFPLDHDDSRSIAAALDEAESRAGGGLDAVFVNGAYAIPGAVEDLPRDALRAIFETNLFGPVEIARRALPAMIARGAGRILFCSSVLGYVAARHRGAYVGTKFALEGMADSLRMELRGTNVAVILIEPGPIATPFRVNARPHFTRWIRWEEARLAREYRERVIPRLFAENPPPDRFELPPAAVTAALIRALDAPRPRARYRVTLPARLGRLVQILPSALRDRILARA
ncbi:MAG: short-chain dehydrogenase/reductase [Paracoccaceae bacterium]|nr:MAG: short-chain dehydrogenase/reductase [Paracoccaceae bacterium]